MLERNEISAYNADRAFKKLKELINESAKTRGIEIEINNELDVLSNLDYLCKVGTGENINLDGSKVRYIPLDIKKLVFRMIYPNGRWLVTEPIPMQTGDVLGYIVTATILDGEDTLAGQTTFFAAPHIKEIEVEVEKKNENAEYVKSKEVRYYQYPFTSSKHLFNNKTSCFVNAIAGLQGRCLTRAFANLGIGMYEFESEVNDSVLSTDGTSSEKAKEVVRRTPLTTFNNTFAEDL